MDVEAEGVNYTPPGGAKTRILEGSNNDPHQPVNDHGLADRILRKEDSQIAAALRAVV